MAWMSPSQWGTAMRNSEDTVPEVTEMPTVESMVALEGTQLESKVTREEPQGMFLIKQDEGTDYASNTLNLDCKKNRFTLYVSLTYYSLENFSVELWWYHKLVSPF